ncbi:MAG TPA: hypothetical protein DCS83_06955 [Prevotella sp.]|nr:hypothetical protein [Prevotella sp.]
MNNNNDSNEFRQYFNDGQLYMLDINARDEIAVCGRGFGKGAFQAVRILTAIQGMPGSMGGFVAPSIKRCLTNTLPSMLIHLERWGFKRDLHYMVGKRPPKSLKWKDPIFTPANWENTISFYNGSVISVISQDRTGTSNSLSLDYIIIDEAKFINFEQLKDETFQANRGNEVYFGDFFLHHGLTITSDYPTTKKGSWFLKYQDMMDPELINGISGLIYQKWKIRQRMARNSDKAERYQKQLEAIDKELSTLRRYALLYKEYSSVENLAILGEDFIKRQKRDLPSTVFDTSIMCKHIGVSSDGFYGGLDEDINEYTAPNEDVLTLANYGAGKLDKLTCSSDADLDWQLPLIIAFDANALINCLVVGQDQGDGKIRIVKSFFTKYDRKLPELVDDFCAYYKVYLFKKIIFYYDSTFIANNYALHNDDFHMSIVHQLKIHSWRVKDMYIGKQWPMGNKMELINNMFHGRDVKHQILINKDNNPDLLVSITNAGVYNGGKDKRGEKKPETETDQFETRTDFSDAFDTLVIGAEKYPVYQGRLNVGSSYYISK